LVIFTILTFYAETFSNYIDKLVETVYNLNINKT